MKVAIAGAYTARKKSGCWPVNSPNIAVILSGRKMNNARIPHAKPKATSRNGTRALKGTWALSVLDESEITIYLLVV